MRILAPANIKVCLKSRAGDPQIKEEYKMNRKLSALVLTVFLATSTVTPAFAADNTADTKGAGITPDSILYPVDRALEAIQLALTSSDMSKAKLLADDAEERLAEAQVMLDRNKAELAEKAADDYDTTVEKADDDIQKAADSTNTQDAQKAADLKAKIDAFLLDHAALEKNSVKVLSELIEKLPAQAAEKVAANIVKQTLHFEAVKNFVNAKKDYNDQKKTVRDAEKALDDANKAGDKTAIASAQAALDDANKKLTDLKTALDDAIAAKDMKKIKDTAESIINAAAGNTGTTAGGTTAAGSNTEDKVQNVVNQAKNAFQAQHKVQVKETIQEHKDAVKAMVDQKKAAAQNKAAEAQANGQGKGKQK